MSIMIDLPPAMELEAREYATVQGTTLERMLFDYLKAELERWRETQLNGKPYKFNRADAYEP